MQATQQHPGLVIECNEPTCPAQTRSHSTIRRFRVKPADIGTLGFVDGGTLLDWIDNAANTVAAQWSGRCCVTASVGNVHLDRPISVGESVELHASLVYTGHSSMHILVTVCSSHPARSIAVQTAQCPIIFVAVDDNGSPVQVPPWTPSTMLELQRHRQARIRIAMRKRIEAAMAAERCTARGASSRTTLRYLSGGGDAGRSGKVSAGRVMRWMDETACRSGTDWAGAQVVMSYLVGSCFYRPIAVGTIVEVSALSIHTGARSIHASICVTTADSCGVEVVADAVAVMVSLDNCGAAQPIPTWLPDSEEDRRLDQLARRLVAIRQFLEPFTSAAPVFDAVTQ